jgi:hypothetical protein
VIYHTDIRKNIQRNTLEGVYKTIGKQLQSNQNSEDLLLCEYYINKEVYISEIFTASDTWKTDHLYNQNMEKFIKDILDRLGKITIELETIFNDNVSSQKQKLADITKKYTFKAWNVIYKEYTLQQTTTNHTDIDKKYADDQKHFDRENFLVEYVLTDKDDFINNDISTVEISGLYDSYLEYDRHDHYDANKIADKNKLIETLYLTYNELKIYLGGPLTVMSSTTNTMSKVDINIYDSRWDTIFVLIRGFIK